MCIPDSPASYIADDTVRKATSAECIHILSVEKHSAIKILAIAAEHVVPELWKSTFQDTTPTRAALFSVSIPSFVDRLSRPLRTISSAM